MRPGAADRQQVIVNRALRPPHRSITEEHPVARVEVDPLSRLHHAPEFGQACAPVGVPGHMRFSAMRFKRADEGLKVLVG